MLREKKIEIKTFLKINKITLKDFSKIIHQSHPPVMKVLSLKKEYEEYENPILENIILNWYDKNKNSKLK